MTPKALKIEYVNTMFVAIEWNREIKKDVEIDLSKKDDLCISDQFMNKARVYQ